MVQDSRTTMPSLPAETRDHILGYLPRDSLRTCLFVSPAWRGVALRLLFSTLRLYFGEWMEECDEGNPPLMTDSHGQCDLATRMAFRCLEIMNYIPFSPLFANSVKHIFVYAYTTPYRIPYERYNLLRALRSLPHLLSFHWYASYYIDSFPREFPLVVANLCPRVRSIGFPRFTKYTQIEQYTDLHCILFTGVDKLVIEGAYDREGGLDIIDEKPFNNPVRKLQLVGSCFAETPFRLFLNLTELTLVNPVDLEGIHLLFQHAAGLESVSLCLLKDYSVFPALENGASLLPYLTSFKLTSDLDHDASHYKSVSDFLWDRLSMKRLCVSLEGPVDMIYPLRHVTHRMVNLEALGLSIGDYPTDPDDEFYYNLHLENSTYAIPKSVKALLLNTSMESSSEMPPSEMFPFVHCSSLNFLHIYSREGSEGLEDEWRWHIDAQLPNLTVFGYDNKFSNIERTGSNTNYTSWSLLKLLTRGVDDFDNPDGEWLTRHNSFLYAMLYYHTCVPDVRRIPGSGESDDSE